MDTRAYKELCEHIHSIENRCAIFRILCAECAFDDIVDLLPTLMEDNYCDCQSIIDDFCIKEAGHVTTSP